ncbi:MAG TPA: hypothetical protein VFY40_08225 [Blastocatellia bacterium]|nr:hypothetical protein [Blastocatellia bacterium]
MRYRLTWPSQMRRRGELLGVATSKPPNHALRRTAPPTPPFGVRLLSAVAAAEFRR